jgi:Flp pilus assembly pilin Flp
VKYQLTEEILLLQKRAGIITESEYQEKLSEVDIDLDDKEQSIVDNIKDEMSGVLKSMETELEKASKLTNEGLLTVASIAIALPAVMGLISKFGKAAGNMVNKVLGNKPNDDDAYQKWMNKLGHIADELHHLYMAPLTAIVKKFVKDESKAKSIASGIFHVIVATFLVASGATAVKALQAKNLSLATLEGALTAVKSGELKSFIADLFK